MATVGEFKKKFDKLPDSAQLEFWVVLDGRLVELTLNRTNESIRSPTDQVTEVLLTTVENARRKHSRKGTLQRQNKPRRDA